MWKRKKRADKAKEMINQLRRFIAGEDISQEFIPQDGIEPGFVLVMHRPDGMIEVNGVALTEDEWKQRESELNQDAVVWKEQKTYIHMKPAPLNAPLTSIDEQPKQIKPVIEPQEVVNDCPAEVEPTPKDSRKERMNLKKLEAQHIREIMLERKIQMDNFTKMNTEFLPGWFQ